MTNRLRTVREKLGLSQEAAARLLNVSLQSVNRWERGKFEPTTGNDTVLALLPIIAAGGVPKPCAASRVTFAVVPIAGWPLLI